MNDVFVNIGGCDVRVLPDELNILLLTTHTFNLLEMQTVIKQAICVSVLQMCCEYGNKQRPNIFFNKRTPKKAKNSKIEHLF